MSNETYVQRKRDGEYFYCPNGHSQHYTETTVMKLEKEIARERQQKDQALADAKFQKSLREYAEQTAAKAEKKMVRLKTRVAAGVCPCCNRYFGDLHSHMSTQHPGVGKELGVSPAVKRRKQDAGKVVRT